MKKNIAVSDVGVACHRKIKRVGQNILGSFTVCHRKPSCDFEELMNWAVLAATLGSSRRVLMGSSRTRPATAEVIRGSTAVTPNTNLQKPRPYQKLRVLITMTSLNDYKKSKLYLVPYVSTKYPLK